MELLYNGLDSLDKSVKSLKKLKKEGLDTLEKECIMKDVVIFLHHSTETLFKYLLQKKDESLIFENRAVYFENNILKDKKSAIKNGNTIQFLNAVQGVFIFYKILDSSLFYNKLKTLNDVRNTITHHKYDFVMNETLNFVALLLPELYSIYSQNIDGFDNIAKTRGFYIDIDEEQEEIWSLSIKKAISIIKFYESFQNEFKPEEYRRINRRKDEFEYINCPVCEKKSLQIDSSLNSSGMQYQSTGKCIVCNFRIDEDVAKFMLIHSLNNITFDIATLEDILISSLINLIFVENVLEYNAHYSLLKQIDFIAERIKKREQTFISMFMKKLYYLLDDICEQTGRYYFECFYFDYNDEKCECAVHENGKINLKLNDCYEVINSLAGESNKKTDDLSEEEIAFYERFNKWMCQLRWIIDLIDRVDIGLFGKVLNEITTSYNTFKAYYNASYIDAEEEEAEFEIQIRVSEKMIRDLIEYIEI